MDITLQVMCSVRVRETEGGVPTNEMTSSEYQAGIFVSFVCVCVRVRVRACVRA